MNHSDDFIGENHISTSAKTPLRADAFSLSDEEKIARIEKSMADIMETLGLDLTEIASGYSPKGSQGLCKRTLWRS